MEGKELEVVVKGRVQGILFRNTIKGFADKTGLKGFAMNKDDGSVLSILQGEKKKLEDFLEWLQKSPGFSKVDGLSYTWKSLGKEYPDFRVVLNKGYIADKATGFVNLGKSLLGAGVMRVPNHVAIIPDGNRRWAKEKGLEGTFGHYKAGSYENLDSLFKEAKKLGVKYLSFWGFSTENWKREEKERRAIFGLIVKLVKRLEKDCEEYKIRFRHVGRKDRLPKDLKEEIVELEKKTEDNQEFFVQLFLDYGGRDEIVRAVNKLLKVEKGKVDEEDFQRYLDTAGIPDPDLVIRTSGEKRMSGLMPFQATYSELYFSEKYFPDFDARELRRAIEEFGKRKRTFGGGK